MRLRGRYHNWVVGSQKGECATARGGGLRISRTCPIWAGSRLVQPMIWPHPPAGARARCRRQRERTKLSTFIYSRDNKSEHAAL